jgi:hypothetical protein
MGHVSQVNDKKPVRDLVLTGSYFIALVFYVLNLRILSREVYVPMCSGSYSIVDIRRYQNTNSSSTGVTGPWSLVVCMTPTSAPLPPLFPLFSIMKSLMTSFVK